jgi:monofunctional biosynthetic peptidoglycan transglycosylase
MDSNSHIPTPSYSVSIKSILIFALFLASAALVFEFPVWPWSRPCPVAELRREDPASTALMSLRRRQAARRKKKYAPVQRWVPLGRISPNLVDAVLSAEDDGFYNHAGVNWATLRMALKYDLKTRHWARGGSTITQQLAKNLYLSPAKNPLRKLREMAIAFYLERRLTKRRILEMYLNVVEWGDGVFGAEAAARAYFQKPASDLSLDEAVALAAVLPSPRRHNPALPSRWVETRKRWVYRRMADCGRLPVVVDRANAVEPAPAVIEEEDEEDDAEPAEALPETGVATPEPAAAPSSVQPGP